MNIVDAAGPADYTYAHLLQMISASIKPGEKFIYDGVPSPLAARANG